MVEVDGDGDIGEADGGLDELLEINRVGVLARAFGNLEHDGRLFLFAGLNDGLEQFHVVDVKGPQRVFALQRLGEQFFGMCQWHKVCLPINESVTWRPQTAATGWHSRRPSAAKETKKEQPAARAYDSPVVLGRAADTGLRC